jgi:hypothetical protein
MVGQLCPLLKYTQSMREYLKLSSEDILWAMGMGVWRKTMIMMNSNHKYSRLKRATMRIMTRINSKQQKPAEKSPKDSQ